MQSETTQFTIEKENNSLFLITRPSPFITNTCLGNSAKWDREKNAWCFQDLEKAEQVISDCFGLSEETVTVEIDKTRWKDGQVITFMGYLLARREIQNKAAELGPGVTLKQGFLPPVGGAMHNARVNPTPDTVFMVTMRKDFAQKHGLI